MNSERPHSTPNQDESAILSVVLEDNSSRYLKIGWCISLYLILGLIWMPGFTFAPKVYEADQKVKPKPIRTVIKPPPKKLEEKVKLTDRSTRRMPMPDMEPEAPEPVVEPDPPEDPELLPGEEWEIGFADPPVIDSGIAVAGMEGVESPIITKRVPPAYPIRAVKYRMQGYVILEAVLRQNGEITDIRVLHGLAKGKFKFEEEAMKALKRWEFLPGKLNGKPTDVRMNLRVQFSLN